DATGIGGNHLIHACRRNIDMTAIIVNNFIYGMTGGQQSPTTPQNALSTTSVYGTLDQPFDICTLAAAAGATYVARSTTYHARQSTELIKRAILHEGFSVVEILSQCPTHFGRRNRQGAAADMMELYKEVTVPIGSKKKKDNPDLIERGVFVEKEAPEYCREYDKIIEMAMKG
ncbi:MAG: thiamine pyrophosphate-dependent enzyme, partial [Elusimicrobiales bacterium]|nr:thiamine pyrophosphate-dependent enzyme [Elusimicrobiales bacterium]